MKKIHVEIMKVLRSGPQELGYLYDGVSANINLGKYGFNPWNFNRALDKLVNTDYIRRIIGDSIFCFAITAKGIKYLDQVKKFKKVK